MNYTVPRDFASSEDASAVPDQEAGYCLMESWEGSGTFPRKVMQSPWSCAPDGSPAQEGAGMGDQSCLTMGSVGHLNLNLGWKHLWKMILAGERRKLRQLNHASRLFQVFHFNQAAILPDFCFEHMPESELETGFVTCGKPKASAFEKQMNLVPDWNKISVLSITKGKSGQSHTSVLRLLPANRKSLFSQLCGSRVELVC